MLDISQSKRNGTPAGVPKTADKPHAPQNADLLLREVLPTHRKNAGLLLRGLKHGVFLPTHRKNVDLLVFVKSTKRLCYSQSRKTAL